VKSVLGKEMVKGKACDLVPITHDRTAGKDVDTELRADVGKKAD
jgi:hypothetical protein